MGLMIRVDLEKLPAYVPGANMPGAVKLASNEVTGGPLPSVVAAIVHHRRWVGGAVPAAGAGHLRASR
jgi:histidinol-phosphate/aromatic aminotransferase/cobyric acid decarboxylase-like protein